MSGLQEIESVGSRGLAIVKIVFFLEIMKTVTQSSGVLCPMRVRSLSNDHL